MPGFPERTPNHRQARALTVVTEHEGARKEHANRIERSRFGLEMGAE